MTTKLRGGRLEAEVDRARTEGKNNSCLLSMPLFRGYCDYIQLCAIIIYLGNWKRMTELLASIKSKQSGMEDMSELAEAEIQLETFLEQQGGLIFSRCGTRIYYCHVLSRNVATACRQRRLIESCRVAAASNCSRKTGLGRGGARGASASRETALCVCSIPTGQHLTISKIIEISYPIFFLTLFQALKDIECSGMERANTPFRTLRALRLVAEAYAIKGITSKHDNRQQTYILLLSGLCIETQDAGDKSSAQSQKSFFCFEKAAELAISYVSELEKSIGTSNGKCKYYIIVANFMIC